MSPTSRPGGKITRADIESKFREVQTELGAGAEKAKGTVALVGGGLVLLLIVLAFLLGRRGGKKRSTIVEIRRL